MADEYRVYGDLAQWWPLISPPEEYTQEARLLADIFSSAGARDVLDLGSGGGGIAAALKDQVTLTLVDLSAPMLAVSRRLNPGCEHVRGDMRTLRLGRTFDGVLVHDAIDYMTDAADLRRVVRTAFIHCRPGGIAVFVPDHTAETFCESKAHGGGGTDASGRHATFTEHDWDPDPGDDWIQADYQFTLRDADGTVSVVRESHRLGAFSVMTWLRVLAEAGFEAVPGTPPAPGRVIRGSVFIGRRPARGGAAG